MQTGSLLHADTMQAGSLHYEDEIKKATDRVRSAAFD
jgi:hypothetical protein